MVRAGLIVNRYSKQMKRKGAFERLESMIEGYDAVMECAEYTEENVAEAYKKPLESLMSAGIDVLYVVSGDGGQKHIDKVLIEEGWSHVPQANLRGGTVNVRAESAGLPGRNAWDRVMPGTPSLTEHLLGVVEVITTFTASFFIKSPVVDFYYIFLYITFR